MGFTKPYLPDVDPDTFLKKPLMERMRILAVEWAENGFGAPRMVHTIYIVKLVVFFAVGGITVATATSGLPAFWHVSQWWNQPIVYQKVILWTVLLEAIGVAGSWGPLAGKVKPMTGGILFWMRPGTIRLRPWKWVPFTNGDRRNWFDIGLYLGLLASLTVALLEPGVHSDSLSKALPAQHIRAGESRSAGRADCAAGAYRSAGQDHLPGRAWRAVPAGLFMFAALPFVNMIIALKLVIVVVWVGAGFSKFGKHFSNVIPPMVSNTIFAPKWVRAGPLPRVPARHAAVAAGGLHGTRQWHHRRDRGPAGPVLLHQQVGDTGRGRVDGRIPPVHHFDVPARGAAGMECGFRLHHDLPVPRLPELEGYAPWNMTPAWLALVIAAALLFYPVLGNLRPDKVSFLASMRQYAGNWASAVWAFAPGAEAKLDRVTRSAPNQVDQFVAAGYEPSGRRSPRRRRPRGEACTARPAACTRCY